MRIYNYPKPTVAAVHGHCLGAGLEMIPLFDFTVAADSAVFGLPEMSMSIIPVVRLAYGFSQLRFAKEAIMAGENFSADRAMQTGLINRVTTREGLMNEAMALARRLALMPPETMSLAKKVCNKINEVRGFDLIAEASAITTVHSLQLDTALRREFTAIGEAKGISAAFEWRRAYFAQADRPFEEGTDNEAQTSLSLDSAQKL
jgi:enoyl-CoA hydratase